MRTALSLRPMNKAEFVDALEIIYRGRKEPWGLKTNQATYRLFKNTSQLSRPNELDRALCFPVKALSYSAPPELLREALAAQYPTELAQWKAGEPTAFKRRLEWWWCPIYEFRSVQGYEESVADAVEKQRGLLR